MEEIWGSPGCTGMKTGAPVVRTAWHCSFKVALPSFFWWLRWVKLNNDTCKSSLRRRNYIKRSLSAAEVTVFRCRSFHGRVSGWKHLQDRWTHLWLTCLSLCRSAEFLPRIKRTMSKELPENFYEKVVRNSILWTVPLNFFSTCN